MYHIIIGYSSGETKASWFFVLENYKTEAIVAATKFETNIHNITNPFMKLIRHVNYIQRR